VIVATVNTDAEVAQVAVITVSKIETKPTKLTICINGSVRSAD